MVTPTKPRSNSILLKPWCRPQKEKYLLTGTQGQKSKENNDLLGSGPRQSPITTKEQKPDEEWPVKTLNFPSIIIKTLGF